MRNVTIALLAVVAVIPATAQEPVPDTTAPWRYHPMGVGDMWEYAYWVDPLVEPSYLDHYERLQVVGDTVISDTLYTVLVGRGFALDGAPEDTSRYTVRFDTANAVFVERSLSPGNMLWPWAGPGDTWACRLDASFPGDPHTPTDELCYAWSMASAPLSGYVDGGYDRQLYIGEQPVQVTAKSFHSFVGVDVWLDYAAGIGLVYSAANEAGGYHRVLGYARVGGVAYGTPLVASEPAGPSPSAPAITVSPNPSHGQFAVAVTLTSRDPILLEAYDTLGRRVHQQVMILAAGSHAVSVDASQWGRGLYIVRVRAGGVNVSTRVVRR